MVKVTVEVYNENGNLQKTAEMEGTLVAAGVQDDEEVNTFLAGTGDFDDLLMVEHALNDCITDTVNVTFEDKEGKEDKNG